MYDFLIDFLGISGDIPFYVEYFVYLGLVFLGIWLIANFVNLFLSNIFSVLK